MNDEILKRLDLLAAKLGVGAQHLWAVLIKEAKVEGFLDLGMFLLLTTSAVAAVGLGIRCARQNDEFDCPEFVMGVLIGTVCLIAGIWFAYAGAVELLNPEFYALSQVLKALK